MIVIKFTPRFVSTLNINKKQIPKYFVELLEQFFGHNKYMIHITIRRTIDVIKVINQDDDDSVDMKKLEV